MKLAILSLCVVGLSACSTLRDNMRANQDAYLQILAEAAAQAVAQAAADAQQYGNK